ncbi:MULTISPECIES: cation:proton antiporter [unclassified Roseofilum]|uniref:cation:proton antiporter n=1 Tax=unclassified Roseofilum TaxID=2620099 RepID=UPI000E830711|nr:MULTISPECIES: cation:proton antiporter [unclassified Roseofilum]MBP0008211.1 cation:proton antiporter [Roseofilum sp. Belize Diploria]MBP0039913.1 cation:proton antiporter [Roseofilum sp. SID1]MBP0041523.1 cation:proton antiporter [Roseofilum sp. SBFL]HBQ97990.1 sodium:proton antiporter [Cyanobacteria bacterium UBA11691]
MVEIFPWVFSHTPTSLTPLLATATESHEPPSATLVLAGVLLSLVTIYLASKIGSELCARLDLPPVLGELLGGVVIGVSVLKLLVFPEGGAGAEGSLIITLLEQTAGLTPEGANGVFLAQSEVISVLSELGVIFLLFQIGLESDLKQLIDAGVQSALVAITGVVVPFLAGTLGLIYLFHVPSIPAIFAGAALTATSIGITAKVLAEIKHLNDKEGQIIIGAAVLDDILGIIILAIVASLAEKGEVEVSSIIYLVLSAAAFLIGSIILGRLVMPYFMGLLNKLTTPGTLLIGGLIIAFIFAYIGAVIQLEAILGAFTAGLILGETEKHRELEELVEPIGFMLVPIFFVTVGAETDLSVLNPAVPSNREGLIIASFLVVVAIVGKVVSGFTLFGGEPVNRIAVGVGMIPRGEVGLVFAGVGSASGVLPESLDAAIIVMVILTTFVAPPLLRVAFQQSETSEASSEEASKEPAAIAESETTQ